MIIIMLDMRWVPASIQILLTPLRSLVLSMENLNWSIKNPRELEIGHGYIIKEQMSSTEIVMSSLRLFVCPSLCLSVRYDT
jgi:hypothetical protein